MGAFLNAKGGTIFVGVNDDGTLSKEFINTNKDDTSTKISNRISDLISLCSAIFIKFSYNEDGVLLHDYSKWFLLIPIIHYMRKCRSYTKEEKSR